MQAISESRQLLKCARNSAKHRLARSTAFWWNEIATVSEIISHTNWYMRDIVKCAMWKIIFRYLWRSELVCVWVGVGSYHMNVLVTRYQLKCNKILLSLFFSFICITLHPSFHNYFIIMAENKTLYRHLLGAIFFFVYCVCFFLFRHQTAYESKRRAKHNKEQSRVWTTIALQRIKNTNNFCWNWKQDRSDSFIPTKYTIKIALNFAANGAIFIMNYELLLNLWGKELNPACFHSNRTELWHFLPAIIK